MLSVPKRIMDIAEALPEATPICPNALLHVGSRAAVDQGLSRLARDRSLYRICQGVYMRPVASRYGPLPPDTDRAIRNLSELWGETFVASGGSAANRLGLTTQLPMRTVYWTSGRNRHLQFGRLRAQLLHVPTWHLALPERVSGLVVRALIFLGPHAAEDALRQLAFVLSDREIAELLNVRPILPTWMAQCISTVFGDA